MAGYFDNSVIRVRYSTEEKRTGEEIGAKVRLKAKNRVILKARVRVRLEATIRVRVKARVRIKVNAGVRVRLKD